MRLKTPTVDIAPVKLYPYVKSKTQTHAFEFASCFCPYRLSPMTHCVPMGRNRYKAKVSASEAVTNINAATVIFTIAAVSEKEAA